MSDRLLGAVMVGGRSRRFGSDKALAPVDDTVMGAIVVAALRDAGIDPVVAVGGTAGPALDLITVRDRLPGEGPLAALATVLRWARHGRVLVVPCDLPGLTSAAVSALVTAGESLDPPGRAGTAVVATVDGKPHHSIAIWPTAWAAPIRRLVDGGERRYRSALTVGPWMGVEVAPSTVVDVDTPDALDRIVRGRPDE